ncbi:response regulator transcription factor [Actomonas aquatica]
MIDDDRKMCRLVSDYLSPLGFAVTAVHDGPSGVERAVDAAAAWDVVLLDVMLPGLDGFEVLKRIRRHSEVPVLMLTARGDEMDRIVGLEVGADDYVPKTFSSRELLARLRAVLRRSAAREAAAAEAAGAGESATIEELVVRELRLIPEARRALLAERELELTPVEFDLLWSLVRAKGRVRSREALLDEVRERHYDVFDRSIDVHISALRKKLGDDARAPRYIRTLRSAGYMMIDPATEPDNAAGQAHKG